LLEVLCGGFGTNLLPFSNATVASWLPPSRASLAEHVKVSLVPDSKDLFSTGTQREGTRRKRRRLYFRPGLFLGNAFR
jgi:hypothetical protein